METRGANLNRRRFFHAALAATAGVPFFGKLAAWAQEITPAQAAAGGPANPTWQAVICGAEEPGEPLVVSGIITAPDGATPVEGARLYVYHTDARGYYRYPSNNSRNPRLRGWMKTNAQGQYEFRTIRPASYPNSRVAQHIHATLEAPGYPARWIDEFHFVDDPMLPESERGVLARDGEFSAVLRPAKDKDGVWRAVRKIRLRR